MKNILKKGSKFFLTALVILNSLMNTLPVHAEETTTDENDLDTIVELGNAEDVLDLYNSKNNFQYLLLVDNFTTVSLVLNSSFSIKI